MSSMMFASAILLAGCTNDEASSKTDEQVEETDQQQEGEGDQQAKGSSVASVSVKDYNSFDTAGNMLAYAEFELSGEPLVEGLGLDLDVLDPKNVDAPTKFDYTAGVEAYEYSEEAMYEVVEKSGLGLHLVNGPAVQNIAEQEEKEPSQVLGERFYTLADQVGYPREEIFQNMYPTMIEYSSGDPHYAQEVNTGEYASNDDGTYVPMYQVDFQSLRWDRGKMDKVLTPAAYGGTFLKQSLWAGDFMGGFHTVDGDEELEAESADGDSDENIALGVSSADGMQGLILTEEIWNKVNYVRDSLFYSANDQGLTQAQLGDSYNPEEGLVYLPHKIAVTEDGNDQAANAESLEVSDASSQLRDQWLMLWPSAEFYGMTDQRPANENVNPAFRALFDSNPYPSAPAENLDDHASNDVASNDPYSANKDVMMHVFKNLDAMHFNKEVGAFVTSHSGSEQGDYVDTFEAGYTIESLRIFERAIDGLPVGYANAESAKGLETEEGKRALELITKQADFIKDKLMLDSGLVASGYKIGEGAEDATTLDAQIGAIRGLTAAYLATKDEQYREAARTIYQAMDEKLWDEEVKAYATKGEEMVYTPETAGGVAAVYRVAINNLANMNEDEQKPASLDRETIVSRYTEFFDVVIDGPATDQGMQVSEFWDTGDFYKTDDDSGNTDQDNVLQIQAGHGEHGIAPVLLDVEITRN
ncbi:MULTISPECIES: hypothetical protein [Pontibacillus]|uniref:Uncharacterized protein n=1 Tax=Pontibacillus chungwhensis TaxID=265426 RepID=A0ABY8V6E4_9BACI|nr:MULTISPECIES: hypothetical protein [Pontibacillus]MCD5325531.1 hypothetical protein [Pontibacillus sp. HN14]WIG00121.1 hypothetical protein QNI29_02940 [Pontibacillus chungwhensis]